MFTTWEICTWGNHMLPLKAGSYVKVEDKPSYFLLWLQSSITGSCTPPFNKKDGKTSLCFCHVYQCVSMCVCVYVCNSQLSAARSESAEMDETLGSHSHFFEAAISHCSDGENLIVLLTRNALIVFLISFQAMWESNSLRRMQYKKRADIVRCQSLNLTIRMLRLMWV